MKPFLYVNGQDIGSLTLGLLSETPILESFTTGPEGYLKAFDTFLRKHKLALIDLEKAIVITGPGSATALRGSLALMNTLAFTSGVVLMGVEKSPEVSDLAFLQSLDMASLSEKVELEPVYAHGPRITPTKRDNLKRLKTNH